VGKRKITCNNSSCKHHQAGGKCDTCITITPSGKCGSFEKGFVYYFHIVWDALKNKNYIDMVEVQQNPDLRIGLYYVMDCYGLGCSEMEWGTCRMLMLKNGEKGESLNYEGIVALGMNKEKFGKHYENFINGIMPNTKEEQEAAEVMRKATNGMRAEDSVERILDLFAKTKNNTEFIQMVKKTRLV